MDAERYSRDVLADLSAGARVDRLREMEAAINAALAGSASLREFQDRLYGLIDDLHRRLGHFLGRWDYDGEVEVWGGRRYMDPSAPNELLLKSTYPRGVELRWGEYDFPVDAG